MTIRTLKWHRNAIADFHRAYVDYVDNGDGDPTLRSRVLNLIPAGQAAMSAAGVQPYLAPAMGGPARTGLVNLAFAHEQPGAAFLLNSSANYVMDWCEVTAAQLEHRIAGIRRQRKNPLHWIDAALRALLGIPAYIVSLFLRVPAEQVDESRAGPLLRFLSATSQAAGIYFGGARAGWW